MSEFTSKQHGAIFDAIKFCSLAVGSLKDKDATRYALHHLRVEPGRIVASDGPRLHLAVVEHDLAPGAYAVVKATKTSIFIDKAADGDFPDYRRLLDSLALCQVELLAPYHPTYPEYLYTQLVRSIDQGVTLKYRYVVDAGTQANYSFSADTAGMVWLASDTGAFQAVIMPVKM